MQARLIAKVLAIAVVFMSALGALPAPAAMAQTTEKGPGTQPAAASMPQTKEPKSARFDITGNIVSGGEAMKINGSGAISGQDYTEDFTYDLPPSALQPGEPSSLTISVMQVGGKMYMKMPAAMAGGVDTWYIVGDANASGGASSITQPQAGIVGPGMEGALTVTNEGKEDINGAPTTRYKVAVDMQRLVAGAGHGTTGTTGTTTSPDLGELYAGMSLNMFMWVGDSDMYLHKFSMKMDMDLSSTAPEGTDPENAKVSVEMTISLRDFDQPIEIVAPKGAMPLSTDGASGPNGMPVMAGMPGLAGLGGVENALAGSLIAGPGMVGTSSEVPVRPESPPMGMPRTGATLPLAALALFGLLSMAAGGLLLRRSRV